MDDTDLFTWTVTDTNRQPSFDQDLGDRSDAENDSISLSAAATDPDDDPLTYAASGLPPGLTINASSGLISGTIAFNAAGEYPVSLTVRDGTEVDDTDVFTWTVTNTNQIAALNVVEPLDDDVGDGCRPGRALHLHGHQHGQRDPDRDHRHGREVHNADQRAYR